MSTPVEVTISAGLKTSTKSIESIDELHTFEELFTMACQGQRQQGMACDIEHFQAFVKSTAADWVQVSRLEQPTMPVLDLYKRRQVLFKVTLRGSEDTAEELHQEPVNSFAVMMANTRKAARWEFLPPPLDNPINGVQRLFNKLLTYARRAKCGFRGDFPIVDMAKTLSAVATAFFCLTSFEEQLFSQHVATACKAPTSFREFCGFSAAAEGSHKKKPALDQDTCKSTAAALVDLTISHPTLNNAVWTPLREMRDALVSCLQQRQQHLAGQSSKAQERQRSQFVQSFENGSVVSHYSAIPYSEDVKTEYDSLNETLCNQPYYEPLPLVDYLPAAAAAGENLSMKKNRWLELLGVQCDIYLLRWLPGGQKEAQYWAIRVDKEAEVRGQPDKMQLLAAAMQRCKEETSQYFTREMQRLLKVKIGSIFPSATEAQARLLIRELTGLC